MPTKPVVTYTHATSLNFSVGPASGNPTKAAPVGTEGFIPGSGIAAENVNYLHNIVGEWLTSWISQGSFLNDLDAHIVETDSSGQTNVARLTVGGGTIGPLESCRIVAPTTGGGEALTLSNFTDGGRSTCMIDHNVAASTAAALRVQNLNGTGPAATFVGSNGATAVRVDSISGVAFTPALIVSVTGTDGDGVSVSTVNGRAMQLAVTGGSKRAPLRLAPSVTPAAPISGDIYVDDTASANRLRAYLDFAWRSMWSSSRGLIHAYAQSLSQSSTSGGGTLIPKASASLTVADGPLQIGDVIHVRASFECGASAAGTALTVGFQDVTNVVDFGTRTVRIFQATGAADERTVVIEADYTVVSAGAQVIAAAFIGSGGPTTVYVRNVSIEVTGVYD